MLILGDGGFVGEEEVRGVFHLEIGLLVRFLLLMFF